MGEVLVELLPEPRRVHWMGGRYAPPARSRSPHRSAGDVWLPQPVRRPRSHQPGGAAVEIRSLTQRCSCRALEALRFPPIRIYV